MAAGTGALILFFFAGVALSKSKKEVEWEAENDEEEDSFYVEKTLELRQVSAAISCLDMALLFLCVLALCRLALEWVPRRERGMLLRSPPTMRKAQRSLTASSP